MGRKRNRDFHASRRDAVCYKSSYRYNIKRKTERKIKRSDSAGVSCQRIRRHFFPVQQDPEVLPGRENDQRSTGSFAIKTVKNNQPNWYRISCFLNENHKILYRIRNHLRLLILY